MPAFSAKIDIKKSLFEWLEYGKVWSSSLLFIIFTFFIVDEKFEYITKMNIYFVTSGVVSLLVYKYFDKDLKFTQHVSIFFDYLVFIAAIVFSKNAYSTLFFWLACGLVITYYITNGYFTLFITAIVIGFTMTWPTFYIPAEEVKYELFTNANYQTTYNTSICVLIIFLYFLGYVSEKVRRENKANLIDAISQLKAEESFPIHNPNPILEYFKDGQLVPRNELAQDFMLDSNDKEVEILSNFAQAVLEDNQNHTFQLYLANHHYLINLVPVEGKVNIYLTDISNLIQTQENLRKKEQENFAIIDAIPGFVTWIDRDLNYVGVNSKFSEFLKKDKSEFIGKGLGQVHSMENQELRSLTEKLINDENQESVSREIHYEYGGSEYWNLININKYNNGDKAVLVSVDTTELKKAQRIILEEQKKSEANARLAAFGEMSAGIAHEINNPLAVIKASVARIKKLEQKEKLSSEELDKMVETTYYGVDRIQKIISGLKNLSRDGVKDPLEKVQVSTIIDDAFILLRQKCNHLGIDLKINCEDDVFIYCQRVQISQVLVILVNNAIDAISVLEEKWIKVDVIHCDKEACISITDSGNGIPIEVKEKIFHPFFTTKEVGKGTGLGLSLAAKIVESHQGSINVDYDSKNTKFDLNLPKNIM